MVTRHFDETAGTYICFCCCCCGFRLVGEFKSVPIETSENAKNDVSTKVMSSYRAALSQSVTQWISVGYDINMLLLLLLLLRLSSLTLTKLELTSCKSAHSLLRGNQYRAIRDCTSCVLPYSFFLNLTLKMLSDARVQVQRDKSC